MFIRKNILPRRFQDAAVTGFLLIIIPTVYYFELFIVLPEFYDDWSFWYTFHFVSGTIILWNICTNMVAIMMVDTSIRGRMMPTRMEPNWRFCSVCESLAPPRSWHCDTCDVCILKRDHHCVFTSCCIGHHNHRYFVVFLAYMFVATCYANYYNISFMFARLDFVSWKSILKVLFPLFTLFFDFSVKNLYLFLCLIIIIGCVFVGVLLYYHMDLILRGVVTHEKQEKHSKYDLGKKLNLIDTFGDKWYLVWVSPFLESKLPRDGINWDTKLSSKAK